MEVHDCFSIIELVTMEDPGVSEDGGAVKISLPNISMTNAL